MYITLRRQLRVQLGFYHFFFQPHMSYSDTRLFGGTYQDVLTRAFSFHGLGLARQAELAAADADLTPAWFAQLLVDATAAQTLPGLDLRQTDQHHTVLGRDEALQQARPLLQDLFFYAKKAYPTTPHADDLFGHRAVTAAADSPALFNTALQAAAQQVRDRQAALLTPGGMPQAKITELLRLAGLAQGGTVDVAVAHGEGTVETDQYVGQFNALWTQLVALNAAAQVAFRQDDTQRRLFRLYPDGPEERSLTADAVTPIAAPAHIGTLTAVTGPAPTRRVTRLDSILGPDRALSFTVAAPGGPVRVALLLLPDDAPASGMALETTTPRHPARALAADLGPAGAQYLLLENDHDQPASVQVRVLPVGS